MNCFNPLGKSLWKSFLVIISTYKINIFIWPPVLFSKSITMFIALERKNYLDLFKYSFNQFNSLNPRPEY